MDFRRHPVRTVYAGQEVAFRFEIESWEHPENRNFDFQILDSSDNPIPFADSTGGITTHYMEEDKPFKPTARFARPGEYRVLVRGHLGEEERGDWDLLDTFAVEPAKSDVLKVALQTGSKPDSTHAVVWGFVRAITERLSFTKFDEFAQEHASVEPYSPYGPLTYDTLHRLSAEFVTETALGNVPASSEGTPTRSPGAVGSASPAASVWIPGPNAAEAIHQSYVTTQVPDQEVAFPLSVPGQYPMDRIPFVELIYVYWLEEAMLFQSLNRILARFQNRRAPGGRDPLSRLAVSPLLPLRGILWGLAESEKDRLSLRRRAAEYEYQYGLQLIGRAVPPAELLVERRTQFLEAFHSLLNACHHFYREDSDKTVDADAFPLLSNLRELHLVLAHGANNQFADASLTARIETLEVQWMLAQPEMHDFLGGRTMIPYDERWMERVDTMKSIQGWSDTSVTHFYDLAVHGEQLLLSVRHGQWNSSGTTGVNEDDAKNWAKEWKHSVQRYIHAYRAVTGVDLSERVDTTMPSTLLQRRLAQKLVRY